MSENDKPADQSTEPGDTADETESHDHAGEGGSTPQTAPDTAGGAPTTSTPPAHRPRS